MSAEQREVARAIAAGPRGEVRGPFIALLHHPALARHLQSLGEQLRWNSKLPPRLLELAVLVTARRWTCQHEWLIHEQLARQAGLDGAVIDALRERREPALKGDEALLTNRGSGVATDRRHRRGIIEPHIRGVAVLYENRGSRV